MIPNRSKWLRVVTHAHLGPIWYHSEHSDFQYSPNQYHGWEFFCRFLQQTGSSLFTATISTDIFKLSIYPQVEINFIESKHRSWKYY